MKYSYLGNTGLLVSRLCFGTLTIGPLQKNLSLAAGASLIRAAIDYGVNFFDTAELYGTYSYLRRALQGIDPAVHIASKSYAYTAEGMRASLEQARRELDRDIIDVFLLHEQEGEHTLRGHREALDYLFEARAKGIVKAVGLSTHRVAGVLAAINTEGLDVIHPLINMSGIGIGDGSRSDMEAAIYKARCLGIGVYGMKPLGGGHLSRVAWQAMDYAFKLEGLDAIAVGMQSVAEIEANARFVDGLDSQSDWEKAYAAASRELFIESWCEGCGACIPVCPQQALRLNPDQTRVVVDPGMCIFCGYCGAACPQFCIKVV